MKLRRLLIKHREQIYEFLKYGLNVEGDGTLYVNFVRKGSNEEHISYEMDLTQKAGTIKILQEKCRKGIDISYHTTGLINYKNVKPNRIYGEPTFNITRPFLFASISIPDIGKLDCIEDDDTEEDNILELPDTISGRVNFSIIIAPYGYHEKSMDELSFAKISYYRVLDLIIVLDGDIPVPESLEGHFVCNMPTEGILDRQSVDKHTAFIQFQQKVNESKDVIIYQPNHEGVWKIIHIVPMRIPPHLSIMFDDPTYVAEKIENESTVAVTRFKVKNKFGHKVKEVVSIQGIELDSEL